MFRRLMPVLALVLAVAACLPALASDRASAALVALEVVDRDSGQWLPEYRHRGDAWIAGTPGHRYAVRLSNGTGERVLVVLSIDGVNAVSGQTASPSQAGYVLEPWQSTEITGWRKSLDDIAQFVFTDLPDSYAARTGRPHDVGVIGIAVFRERQPLRTIAAPPPIAGGHAREQAASRSVGAPSADRAIAEAAPQRLGTGHGQREWAPVGRTTFRRLHAHPQQVTQLRYDDAATLVALGVLPRPRPASGHPRPRASPGGFVPDPPGGR